MKNISYLLVVAILFSCDSKENSSEGDDKLNLLLKGKWMLTEHEGNEKYIKNGVVFSKDKQYFDLDSQGKIIPSYNEKIFVVLDDTLKVVDYRFEPKFIKKKGTKIYYINKLNESYLELESIFPDKPNTFKLENSDL
ncbi:MAG: hypothetical protein WED10_11260 [Brumimicrobium sp.]